HSTAPAAGRHNSAPNPIGERRDRSHRPSPARAAAAVRARAVKLGVTPWQPHAESASALAAQAVRAEALGYHSFWVPESHFRAAQNVQTIPEPLMWLAAVAASTERLRLATTSLLLPLRHPLQAAEQVAVLDRLSGGRVILGIGRGY